MQLSQIISSINDVFSQPNQNSGASKRLALFVRVFESYNLQNGQLKVSFNGQTKTVSTNNSHGFEVADICLRKPFAFLYKLYTQGHIGFAKAYMDGDISSQNLHALLTFAAVNADAFQDLDSGSHPLRALSRLWHSIQHKNRHNSKKNARKNIAAHYDLGNDFYSLWLDESMTYSSAYYEQPNVTLAQAQQAKIQRILNELDLKKGQDVLEIGCGWGSFAMQAAQQGVNVKGLTLSQEQLRYANERFANLKSTSAHAKAHLQDYRDETGQYDAIVSIEMFEAVGTKYWQGYFDTLKRSLKPGGKAMLQVIVIEGDESDVLSYQSRSDFIQTYVFPGGVLPSKAQLKTLADENGLNFQNLFCFGDDYAKTLEQWRHNVFSVSNELGFLGYDAYFQRLWEYYLVYCQVGFEQKRLDVVQFVLEKPAD